MSFKIFLCIFAAFIYSTSAYSWGDIGHSTVGEIAERNLTPKAKAFVQSILGIEPLAVSATWPDHVRDDKRFKEFAAFHFWNNNKNKSFKLISEEERETRDAHTIISQAQSFLASNENSREMKMIFLRYFIHVMGDLHQPLHIGSGLDKGANFCNIKYILKNDEDEFDDDSTDSKSSGDKGGVGNSQNTNSKEVITNLHSFWDSKIIDFIKFKQKSKKFFSYDSLVRIIMKDMKNIDPSISYDSIKGTPLDWYEETRSLLSFVYPDKEPTLEENRPYCRLIDSQTNKIIKGNIDNTKIPLIDENYLSKAIPIVEKQLVLGGLRLAYLLNKMAEDSAKTPNPKVTTAVIDEDEVLNGVLIKNTKFKSN